MKYTIFKGVVSKIYDIAVKSVKSKKYQISVPYIYEGEEKNSIFFLMDWEGVAEDVEEGETYYFVCETIKRQVTSKKAINRDDSKPFIYYDTDFNIYSVTQDKQEIMDDVQRFLSPRKIKK